MNKKVCKTVLFFIVFFIGFIPLIIAQKKHFIYIQCENKQLFYITIDTKTYSSSANGYLVIPRLKNGKYYLTASFANDAFAEQKFTLIIADKDLGYALKRNATKDWELFDLVAFTTTTSVNKADWEQDKATNDTIKLTEDETVFVTPVKPKKEETTEKTEPKTEVKTADTAINTNTKTEPTNTDTTTKNVDTNTQTNTEDEAATRVIIKTYEHENKEGIDLVYVDYLPAKNDTITVFVPYGFYVNGSENKKEPTNTNNNTNTGTTLSLKNTKAKPGNSNEYNRGCVNLATEQDFDKTRKAMSLETTDDKMIAIAKKNFKQKCYSVEQIKKLGLLFVSEQNRYKFFVAAKNHIYDMINFPALEAEFTLSNFIEQFRKLSSK